MEGLIRITPDRERAESLLGMVEIRIDTVNILKKQVPGKYASKIVEEYYEAALELVTALMSIDGFKTRSDAPGAHISSIEYMREYKEFGEHEIQLMEDLRRMRAGIKYYGRKVGDEYVFSKEKDILLLIGKLRSIIMTKLGKR